MGSPAADSIAEAAIEASTSFMNVILSIIAGLANDSP
jgi:hypothetical protein